MKREKGNSLSERTKKFDFATMFFVIGVLSSPSTLKSMSVATLIILSSNGKTNLYW